MERKVEGTHMVFLKHITGNLARMKVDRRWETIISEVVQ